MCTLTFFPQENGGFILTSNRDESPERPTLSPRIYDMGGLSLLYPKDEIAGGTWIAAASNKRIVSLLNGGFKAHEREDAYRKSRGLVVMDVLSSPDLDEVLISYDLNGIEPFTVVIMDWNNGLNVTELVWDGENRHINKRDNSPRIWSASLLYSDAMKKERINWFEAFLHENPDPGKEIIMNFHKTAGQGNKEYGLIMDRFFVKTRSITQIIVEDDLSMSYEVIGGDTKENSRLEFN